MEVIQKTRLEKNFTDRLDLLRLDQSNSEAVTWFSKYLDTVVEITTDEDDYERVKSLERFSITLDEIDDKYNPERRIKLQEKMAQE